MFIWKWRVYFQKSCFLLCYHDFIVLVSCFLVIFFNLVKKKKTCSLIEINWNAQWKKHDFWELLKMDLFLQINSSSVTMQTGFL